MALPDAQAQAFDAYAADDSGDDLLGIDDPDFLDISPPMSYVKRGVTVMRSVARSSGDRRTKVTLYAQTCPGAMRRPLAQANVILPHRPGRPPLRPAQTTHSEMSLSMWVNIHHSLSIIFSLRPTRLCIRETVTHHVTKRECRPITHLRAIPLRSCLNVAPSVPLAGAPRVSAPVRAMRARGVSAQSCIAPSRLGRPI